MSEAFKKLCEDYLSTVWRLDPVRSTTIGIHHYDDLLTDYTPAAASEDLQARHDLLSRCGGVDTSALTPEQQIDLSLMLADLKSAIAEHELEVPRRAPYIYIDTIGRGLNVLIERNFASLEERGTLLFKRLQAVPGFLKSAQNTLEPAVIPPIWMNIAISGARGLGVFLADTIKPFAEMTPLSADIIRVTQNAQSALEEFQAFLLRVEPDCKGIFAVGPDHFNSKLRDFQMVRMDAQDLHEFGQDQIAYYEKRLAEVARGMDESRTWVEIIEEIKDNHPKADELVSSYSHEMELAREFVEDNDLVSIPRDAHCVVDWTPAYMQATVPLGVMYTTPPFEPGLNSKLLIKPVDSNAPPKEQREHLRENNYAFQRSIALHEVYPGHHLQRSYHKLSGSNVRKNFSAPIFVEGWGLYTEDLMHEAGYLSEPHLHLLQLKNALWRAVRVVIDTGLHTRGMSFDHAVELLQNKVRMESHMAQGEVRRYTTHSNPTYPSSYLVGKTLILKLREDYAKRQGNAFSLKSFHDRLLSYGSIPLQLIRQAMLS